MKKIKFLFLAATLGLAITSCDDDDIIDVPKVTTGVYALSEGSWGGNNTTLSYYDFSTGTATTDYYANKNGSNLGDLGNDILLYGGKIYIVMNGSSYVEVANAFTATSIKKIEFKTAGGSAKQPRYAVAHGSKVFVSSYDGTVSVIDTALLTIEKNITVGKNPEQMVISGNNLYVTNSGGLSPTYDNTVSVISLTSLTETSKISVGTNPGAITADDAGNVYVGCTGDYGTIGPKLVKINTANNSVTFSADTAVGKIKYYNGYLYATGGYLGSPNLRKLSTTDFKAVSNNFVTDGSVVMNAYGLNINTDNGDVYITDSRDYITSGEVFCFDKDGKKKFSFRTTPGLNPNSVAFIRQ